MSARRNQFVAIAGALLTWSPENHAQVSGDLSIEVSECVELTSEIERYACYDRLTEAALLQQAAGNAVTHDTDTDTDTDTVTAPAGNSRPADIVSTITALEETRPNSVTVTLENGQIWRQVGSKRYPLRPGFDVRIYASRWGGSYRLNAIETGGFIQVERIR